MRLLFSWTNDAFPSVGFVKAYFNYNKKDEKEVLAQGNKVYGERKSYFLDKNGVENPLNPSAWYSDKKWNSKYPKIAISWRANWANLSTYFKYLEAVRPSMQAISISSTLRAFILFNTESQNFALSFSPTHIHRTSFFPSILIPIAIYTAFLIICPSLLT